MCTFASLSCYSSNYCMQCVIAVTIACNAEDSVLKLAACFPNITS